MIACVVFGVIGIKLTNAVLTGALVSASVIDPASIMLVPFLIGITAVVAASLSARKAAATNPAVVLRADG